MSATPALASTAAVLDGLLLAHATSIPFKNVDVLLGRTPRLDAEALQAKPVRQRRGGYRFEQNLLLAAALEQLGFRVARLAARVWYRATSRLPRTHMLLQVGLPDGPRLADVGFGGRGPLQPIPRARGGSRAVRPGVSATSLGVDTASWSSTGAEGGSIAERWPRASCWWFSMRCSASDSPQGRSCPSGNGP